MITLMKNSKDISTKIRENFCNFFNDNGHTIIPSSSLIPENDPSLLFTNSGMVQFKNFFTGQEFSKNKNVVTIQKCMRAGGKHNDLENVGLTPRHHTFFEMLGNFSFGGYFKEKSIEFAWKFLVKELGVPKNRLIITHHSEDGESEKIWKKISGLASDKIIAINSEDNFWSMGDTGPCGYCSEIFFDNGDELSGGLPGSADEDGERFVEIWNLVFMEYQKNLNGTEKLKTKCVDTGMGLERITAVISGKKNNYETDLFVFVFEEIEKLIKVKLNESNKVSFRIISDHIKSICMLMSDGIIPSNEGRGYVLRRIIRRAILQVNKIKKGELLLNKLVRCVVKKYSDIYYNLEKSNNFILENLRNEEEKFYETLNTGLSILNNELTNLKGKKFSPDLAFKLYDTYGFPIDVTKNILDEKNIKLDMKNYLKIVESNKQKQKSSWAGSGETLKNDFFLKLKEKLKGTHFLGYEKYSSISRLDCIVNNGRSVKKASLDEDNLFLIFNKTPFYAESGGQVGDTGKIFSTKGDFICDVKDTQKIDGDIFLHLICKNNSKKNLVVNNEYLISIDRTRREKIRNNHSATHLLHEALRTIIGDHVGQKGSLVSDDKLRFDFTCNTSLTKDQIKKIEFLINDTIRLNLPRTEKLMPVKDAVKSGAIALFGEKYPEKVRVISFQSEDYKDAIISKELCGGTHVNNTGQIGFFKILSDSSVASGVRRIEAITGEESEIFLNKKLVLFEDIKTLLKANDENIKDKIILIKNDLLKLRKQSGDNKFVFSKEKIINLKTSVYFDSVNIDSKDLKNFSDYIKRSFSEGIIILLNIQNEKISVVVSVTKNILDEYDAVEILKKIINYLGGKGGGGRKDLAQGGAPNTKKVDGIKEYIENLI